MLEYWNSFMLEYWNIGIKILFFFAIFEKIMLESYRDLLLVSSRVFYTTSTEKHIISEKVKGPCMEFFGRFEINFPALCYIKSAQKSQCFRTTKGSREIVGQVF